MEVAHPNQPLIQKALGDCVELPPMAMPIYDIIHVPEGPLVILEHPKVAPLDDKAQIVRFTCYLRSKIIMMLIMIIMIIIILSS